jgi:G3E family GTPase
LQLLHQLSQKPWVGVLAIQPLVMVVDTLALISGEDLVEAQAQALEACGLLVLNKSKTVDDQTRLLITDKFPALKRIWTEHGTLDIGQLPLASVAPCEVGLVSKIPVDINPYSDLALWTDPAQPICIAQQGEGGWSIGWRWHPSRQFNPQRLEAFLGNWPWRRAKGVIHSKEGWLSFNGLNGILPEWQTSAWRRDTRLELIFDQAHPLQPLQDELAQCLAE